MCNPRPTFLCVETQECMSRHCNAVGQWNDILPNFNLCHLRVCCVTIWLGHITPKNFIPLSLIVTVAGRQGAWSRDLARQQQVSSKIKKRGCERVSKSRLSVMSLPAQWLVCIHVIWSDPSSGAQTMTTPTSVSSGCPRRSVTSTQVSLSIRAEDAQLSTTCNVE